MKKLFTILSIALLSSTAYAEDAAVSAAPAMDTPTAVEPAMDAPTAESIDLNAKWKALDTDTDGSISKEESNTDSDVSSNWDTIDVSQDGKVDPQEFVRFFTKS